MTKRTKHLRGFFSAEAIVALALLAFIMILLAVALGRQQKVLNRVADSRAALRIAEATLTAMQTHRIAPTAAPASAVRIIKLDTPCECSGYAWAKVQATVNGRSASLVGVVPASSIPPRGGS